MIRIAQIINTRGLKGECKLYLYTDEACDRFRKGNVLYLDDKTPLTVASYSEYKGFGYARFEEITSLEQAETLKGKTLYLPKEKLPEPDEDEFYYHQLIGLEVYNQEGEYTGEVSDILETGANIVLRVKNKKDGKMFLLPFAGQFVKDVDLENHRLVFEEMEGLR